MKRDFLRLRDLRREELLALLERAITLKDDWEAGTRPRPLEGKSVALLFEKPSTRTRVSFEVGIAQLGGQAVFLSGSDSQLSRAEPLRDTARVLSGYVNGVVIRTFAQDSAGELARFASVPVINALTDSHHPCQLLGDLLTVRQHFGQISGLKYCWLGDGNNMAHSWIEAAALLGFSLSLACPAGFEPDPEIVAQARAGGGRIELGQDPLKAIAGADVVSTDVWASMGQEGQAASRRQLFRAFRLDEELLARAGRRAAVLHCLPAHRDEEISEAVLEGPQSLVWREAENRLHAQKALLEFLLGG